ncbi:hypothetical protein CFIMG_008676RA00001 [Ceratocystis fimbriata CBS 114723]|uniref:Uncharacterized protein n=1 Tax=Ceratocystis fimbriata CBS 114723 TaxID=1035309 RepID=A0A2C5X0F1_9PEZI|nr:hypothetical protein CFIMG_008676RA00001 [Ceratocystis fimbriata CBS 114723]
MSTRMVIVDPPAESPLTPNNGQIAPYSVVTRFWTGPMLSAPSANLRRRHGRAGGLSPHVPRQPMTTQDPGCARVPWPPVPVPAPVPVSLPVPGYVSRCYAPLQSGSRGPSCCCPSYAGSRLDVPPKNEQHAHDYGEKCSETQQKTSSPQQPQPQPQNYHQRAHIDCFCPSYLAHWCGLSHPCYYDVRDFPCRGCGSTSECLSTGESDLATVTDSISGSSSDTASSVGYDVVYSTTASSEASLS